MNKPDFLHSPSIWTRAHRVYVDPVKYASPIECFQRKGHTAVVWVGVSILAAFCVAFLVWMK